MSIFSMAKNVFKNMLARPATLMYPVKKRAFYPNTRGKIEVDINTCIFCGICQKKCPSGAIGVNKPFKTWEIERFKCIMCNYCVEVCPKKCLKMANQYPDASIEKSKEVFENARVSDNTANS